MLNKNANALQSNFWFWKVFACLDYLTTYSKETAADDLVNTVHTTPGLSQHAGNNDNCDIKKKKSNIEIMWIVLCGFYAFVDLLFISSGLPFHN